MHTPEQDEQRAAQLEAEARALRAKAKQTREQPQPVSPPVKPSGEISDDEYKDYADWYYSDGRTGLPNFMKQRDDV